MNIKRWFLFVISFVLMVGGQLYAENYMVYNTEKPLKKTTTKKKQTRKKISSVTEKRRAKKQAEMKRKALKEEKRRAKALRKKEKMEARHYLRVRPEEEELDRALASWKKDLARFKSDQINTRIELMRKWKSYRKKEVAKGYVNGEYADLFKLPYWPVEALFIDNNTVVRVNTNFLYQTSSYNSSGSKTDLSKFIFGEEDIKLTDILVAYRFLKKEILENRNYDGIEGQLWIISNNMLNADNLKIPFMAESYQYVGSIDFGRNLFDNTMQIGVHVPFGYCRHNLKFPVLEEFKKYSLTSLTPRINYPDTLTVEANHYYIDMIKQILIAKGINYNERTSVTGVGDIAVFANFDVNSRYWDKANVGLRFTFPTSKEPDPNKLWAPQLGLEYTRVGAHAAFLWGKSSWVNPHLFAQFNYAMSAHVHRRVPRRITKEAFEYDGISKIYYGKAFHIETESMLFGDLVEGDNNYSIVKDNLSEWDTLVKGLADRDKIVTLQPGPEFFIRIGNMFEKFLLRRGFLDVYYDFSIKFDDSYTGLPESDWNLRLLEIDTNRVAHNIGLNYSYQFDRMVRINCGLRYTFAGRNTPQDMECNVNFHVDF